MCKYLYFCIYIGYYNKTSSSEKYDWYINGLYQKVHPFGFPEAVVGPERQLQSLFDLFGERGINIDKKARILMLGCGSVAIIDRELLYFEKTPLLNISATILTQYNLTIQNW